jgi:hypothetical protein
MTRMGAEGTAAFAARSSASRFLFLDGSCRVSGADGFCADGCESRSLVAGRRSRRMHLLEDYQEKE